MAISQTIIEELQRYNKINNYIFEQEAGLPPVPPPPGAVEGDAPTDTTTPPPPATGGEDEGTTPPESTEPIDVANDPDVEKIGEDGEEGGSEELDITDLVTSQKNIETKQEEYFNNLFSQLSNLENKLSEMDKVFGKLNDIEQKIEKYREKTPQEKLELRSLDSGPFNQKLTDFFTDKQEDIEKSGKNEYVLTTDEVENYSPSEIKTTFNDYAEDSKFKTLKY
jgi:hypothetical protein